MLGFVAGTLVFSILSLADRFSPVRLFFICSCLGAVMNSAIAWLADDATDLFLFRFLTGFFIAGIYPVGMKIAADWFDKGLGKALGFLLGALVLGTAFPHLLKNRDFEWPWKTVLYITSLFASLGGLLMMFFVKDGPYHLVSGRFHWNAIPSIFQSKKWRSAAFGYFGHMWELYSFWGFLPLLLELYSRLSGRPLNIPLLSFLVITGGGIGCIAGGYLSQKRGSARVAFMALLISGACCLLSPFIFHWPLAFFLVFLFVWGFTVAPDSPQFSTLVAQFAPGHLRGTALTIYNSIGFTISSLGLVVIDRVYYSQGYFAGENTFLLLGAGALVGLPYVWRLLRAKQNDKGPGLVKS
jgi:MFS family permease